MKKIDVHILATLILSLLIIHHASAKTENGNDFCLYLDEAIQAKDKGEIKYLKEESKNVNYFFRYLAVSQIKGGRLSGRPYIDIVAQEPSSYFNIKFRVKKKISLTKLLEEPETKQGSAVAVTGKIKSIDTRKKLIVLSPVIIRYKDRLAPKVGKESLGEVDSTATYYSFTAVKGKKVSLSYADKDLIDKNRSRIPKFTASYEEKEAWADFLIKEKAKRDKIRAKKLIDAKIKAGIMKGSTEAPKVPAP